MKRFGVIVLWVVAGFFLLCSLLMFSVGSVGFGIFTLISTGILVLAIFRLLHRGLSGAVVAPTVGNLISPVGACSGDQPVAGTRHHMDEVNRFLRLSEGHGDTLQSCMVALVPEPSLSKTAVRCEALLPEPFSRFLLGYIPEEKSGFWRAVVEKAAAKDCVVVLHAEVWHPDDDRSVTRFYLRTPTDAQQLQKMQRVSLNMNSDS